MTFESAAKAWSLHTEASTRGLTDRLLTNDIIFQMLGRMCLNPSRASAEAFIMFDVDKTRFFSRAYEDGFVHLGFRYGPFTDVGSCEMLALCNRLNRYMKAAKVTWSEEHRNLTFAIEVFSSSVTAFEQTFRLNIEALLGARDQASRLCDYVL